MHRDVDEEVCVGWLGGAGAGGEEGLPQQFLVRATFSSFSRPSHLFAFLP